MLVNIITITFILIILSALIFIAFMYVHINVLVSGSSMLPTYKDGDLLDAKRMFYFDKNKDVFIVGDVYVFYKTPKKDSILIKRLTDKKYNEVSKKTDLYFLGDNQSDSLDSRTFGYISSDLIIAKIK